MGQLHAFGLHQHPMNATDFDPRAFCQVSNISPLTLGNFSHVFGQSEWRNLDGGITALRDVRESVLECPSLEDFIADGEFHAPLGPPRLPPKAAGCKRSGNGYGLNCAAGTRSGSTRKLKARSHSRAGLSGIAGAYFRRRRGCQNRGHRAIRWNPESTFGVLLGSRDRQRRLSDYFATENAIDKTSNEQRRQCS